MHDLPENLCGQGKQPLRIIRAILHHDGHAAKGRCAGDERGAKRQRQGEQRHFLRGGCDLQQGGNEQLPRWRHAGEKRQEHAEHRHRAADKQHRFRGAFDGGGEGNRCGCGGRCGCRCFLVAPPCAQLSRQVAAQKDTAQRNPSGTAALQPRPERAGEEHRAHRGTGDGQLLLCAPR